MRALLLLWIAGLSLTAGLQSQASPLQVPRRLIDGQPVDLTPLFHWWTNHHGSRPLTAWVHVTGSVVGAGPAGWVVLGHVETRAGTTKTPGKETAAAGTVRILLRNPPWWAQTEFETLKAQLAALENEQATLSAREARARNDALALSRVRRNRVAAAESRQARQVEAELKQEEKPLAKEIQVLKTRLAAYPNADHYTVDCLALQTEEKHDGLRVYNHGVALVN